MRICALNITHRNADIHKNALVDSCNKVASPGTEIVYKDTKIGVLNMRYFGFDYTNSLNGQQMIESMIEARREGCDAIIHD